MLVCVFGMPVSRSPIIVSNVHKSTVFKTSVSAVAGSLLPDARVESCQDSFIYLLCPTR